MPKQYNHLGRVEVQRLGRGYYAIRDMRSGFTVAHETELKRAEHTADVFNGLRNASDGSHHDEIMDWIKGF